LQSLRKRASCGVVDVTVGTKRSDGPLEIASVSTAKYRDVFGYGMVRKATFARKF